MATLGNATDFGDQLYGASSLACCSSPTRGVFPGRSGPAPSYAKENIEFVTFATTGNAIDFGDARLVNSFSSGM